MKLTNSLGSLAASVFAVLALGVSVRAETVTVGTYNVEHFNAHFSAFHLERKKIAGVETTKTPESDEFLTTLKALNDRANWMTAQVILDPAFSPDVLVFEECCGQSDLEFFNKRWLNGAYETVVVFPGNSDRNQNVGLIMKPGFKILEKRDQYYQEKDPGQNARGDKLFARGPAFVLVQTPSGYKFWLGGTHQKSKSGNSVEVTQWRIRESKRTHEIVKELEKSGASDDVLLVGDMNDELGKDNYEEQAGEDAVEALVGPAEAGLSLVTKPLAEQKEISFGGYWNPRYRGLIDHAVTTKAMTGQVKAVQVFKSNCLTTVSSDHYPVMIKFESDPVGGTAGVATPQPATPTR